MRGAARDVDDLARALGAPSVVIGHSLGEGGVGVFEISDGGGDAGVVAGLGARKSVGRQPAQRSGSCRRVAAVPARIPSRRWLARELSPQFSSAMIDWIGSNLRNVGDELELGVEHRHRARPVRELSKHRLVALARGAAFGYVCRQG